VTVRRSEWLPAAVTAAAMIATPLARRGGVARRGLANVVVSGLCATTTAAAAREWGRPRAIGALAAVTVATGAAEHAGTATGVPFGRYRYTGALRPQVAGVPAIVPLAWFAVAVPAREAAHAVLGERSSRTTRVVGGAAALVAWDLFLDPQMVGEGYWAWEQRGRYRGIPASNYAGWFLTALGVMALLEVVLPVAATDPPDPVLVGEYAAMATMETLGFAAFFKDRVVAVVGGLAMVPLAAAATRRVWMRRDG
jgi:putative membrane protein